MKVVEIRFQHLNKSATGANSENSSNSNSLTRSNKFVVSNDFIFSASQFQRNNKNFDTIMSGNEPPIINRKQGNNAIISGLSNMKRRKKQQEFMSQDQSIFGNSLWSSNEGIQDTALRGRDHIRTRYNSFKNSPLMSANKNAKINDVSLGTIYTSSRFNNLWQNSAVSNTSFNGIKKNKSRDGLIQHNARQNLQLKIKKRGFGIQKKSSEENRREINMPSINSQNRRRPADQFNIQMHAMDHQNEGLKSDLMPPEGNQANTSLNNYHTKSFENVLQSSSSVIFKNLKKTKPDNRLNKRILASLANKKKVIGESASNTKNANETIAIEEGSILASDAYSYVKDNKKDSTKVQTQDSSTINQEESRSENLISEKIPDSTYYSQTKPSHYKSMAKQPNEDLRSQDEEKQYWSDQMIKEYEDDLDRDFESPIDYKAKSPSPFLNNSAMSKEVGLDDRTSKIKEDEILDKIIDKSATESISFPLTAAKTIIHYGKYLSEYEESEILNYMVIYYVNTKAQNDKNNKSSKKKTKKSKSEPNEIKVVSGEHLCYRYEIIESLGKGAFGEVIKCYDHKEKEEVAIKILKNSADNYEQGMNEVNILRYIKESDPEDVRNIIKLKDTFIFRNQICIGFEIMDMNLYDVIKGRNFRGMKVKYIRRIALHILVGLWFLARQQVIHWDLKPENILLKK